MLCVEVHATTEGTQGDGALSNVNGQRTHTQTSIGRPMRGCSLAILEPRVWYRHFQKIAGRSRHVQKIDLFEHRPYKGLVVCTLWDTVMIFWRRNCKCMLLGHTRTVCPPGSCGSVCEELTLWYLGGRPPLRERGIGCSHS